MEGCNPALHSHLWGSGVMANPLDQERVKQEVYLTLLLLVQQSQIDPSLFARINDDLNHRLSVINQANEQQKQLLRQADSVTLCASLLTGAVLPQDKATQYITTIERDLQMAHSRNTLNTQRAESAVDLVYMYGNPAGFDESELRRMKEDMERRINKINAAHDAVRLHRGPAPDGNENNGPRYGSNG